LNGVNNARAGPSRQTGRPSLSTRSERIQAGSPFHAPQTEAGSSRLSASQLPRRPHHDDPVRAAQDQATRVWRADMRSLLERAEQRFADVCWTTAHDDAMDHRDLDSELGHSAYAASSTTSHTNSDAATNALIPPPHSTIPGASANPDTLIWAHKAILYARAPNSFQTRFLNLRAPAAQLQHIGSTTSLVSLPLHRSNSELSLASDFSSSTQTGAVQAPTANGPAARYGMPAHPRRSIRGAAPPSSFSMKKPSLRKPISRSSISRPLRKGSVDEFNSIASGYATSDSEGEAGSTVSLRTSRLMNANSIPTATRSTRPTSPSKVSQSTSSGPVTNVPARKPSFASVTSTADSNTTYARSSINDASTVRTPITLKGVSPAFFEATLQYLYTGEEAMVDAFEFLFEDRLASGVEITPEEKLDKLRSDLTFMWRSKLFSDVKLVLGDDDVDEKSDGEGASSIINKGRRRGDGRAKMMDIPDANMSVLSLAQTIDTDRVEESDAEDDELTSFSTHRMILASRSEYFASLLLSPYADSRAPVLHLPSPPFTPASLHFTLGFIYTGTLFFSNRTFDLSTAFSLWRAGAYLQMETLQTLVVALIDREFCHGFACSPPCRKCVKRVPRALAFATSPDVSEQALQESALAAVSGLHFGMYWAKDVGNLDPMLQDRIVESISGRLAQDPTLIVSVLRQLSIVGQRIDTERSARWVESLRLVAETVSNRVMPILHNHLDTIVTSTAWSDLLDGVGSLGDVLEKCLVMLIDGLTEARAAQIYQTLVGQVLLREQGFEVAQSRQAVESARGSILRYLKKRWINVRALAGFNRLEKWCLKEIADELEVTTTELYLAEVPPSVKSTTLPGRFMAAKRSSSLGGGAAAAVERRSSAVGQRSSLGVAADSSRTRINSATPTAAAPARATAVARKSSATNEGEREAGPIHMRAAVLNRNAAKVSVANGHRSLSSSASNASVASQAVPLERCCFYDAKANDCCCDSSEHGKVDGDDVLVDSQIERSKQWYRKICHSERSTGQQDDKNPHSEREQHL
ncbi:BTB domain-containing protein, partial [Pseudozyma hubeiensis]